MFQFNKIKNNVKSSSVIQMSLLVILRIAIGWHFLYEGISKLLTPEWSSEGYLSVSKWIFSGFYKWIASNPSVLKVADLLNIWGLILIGLSLMFGCFTRIASITGIFLLLLYYLANPPFIGMDFGIFTEGNYLIVDKNLIEMLALCVLVIFPTGTIIGLDRLLMRIRNKIKKPVKEAEEPEIGKILDVPVPRSPLDRREILKSLATVPFFGAFIFAVLKKLEWESYEEKNLVDAVTSSTIKTFNFSSLKDLKGEIPHGYIRDLKLSKVILGGNLIGGWAHARDLIYVSKLIKAYHRRDKVFETMMLAEKCGINSLLTNPVLGNVFQEYWKRNIGRMQFISDCGGMDLLEKVKMSIDFGACACYAQGEISDILVRKGKIDVIGKAIDLIRENDLPAGIGAHKIETIKACVDYGLVPDFWVKTLHHRNYWSAQPKEEHDNIFCRKPEETISFMKNLKQPFIAFKILAAGAIHPEDGFRYAFENGADFICVGMYDFQIVDDVNIALNVLSDNLQRERPWTA